MAAVGPGILLTWSLVLGMPVDGAPPDHPATPPPPQAKTASGKSVRVAGIVLKWVRGDKAANYNRVEPMIREAAAGGARIICTTECFLDGYAIADKGIPWRPIARSASRSLTARTAGG